MSDYIVTIKLNLSELRRKIVQGLSILADVLATSATVVHFTNEVVPAVMTYAAGLDREGVMNNAFHLVALLGYLKLLGLPRRVAWLSADHDVVPCPPTCPCHQGALPTRMEC